MKAVPYTYTTPKWDYNPQTRRREKVGMEERTVEAASMFDVNKAIMRCLVKNLAMFGLGLYVYAGEDLPEDAAPQPESGRAEDAAHDNVSRETFDFCVSRAVANLSTLSEYCLPFVNNFFIFWFRYCDPCLMITIKI